MSYGQLPEIDVTIDGAEQKIAAFPVVVLNPPKQCLLKLPTSAELMDYLGTQRSRMHDLGRGKSKFSDIPNPRADRKLFDAIRIDKTGPEFDDAEALYAISLITRLRVRDCVRDGQNYVVRLDTMFGLTTHTVSIPWRKDMVEYQRAVDDPTSLPGNVEEHRFPPEVPARLYDKILQAVDGYLAAPPGGPELVAHKGYPLSIQVAIGVVPPHHKRAVINSVMEALSLLDPSLDPNS